MKRNLYLIFIFIFSFLNIGAQNNISLKYKIDNSYYYYFFINSISFRIPGYYQAAPTFEYSKDYGVNYKQSNYYNYNSNIIDIKYAEKTHSLVITTTDYIKDKSSLVVFKKNSFDDVEVSFNIESENISGIVLDNKGNIFVSHEGILEIINIEKQKKNSIILCDRIFALAFNGNDLIAICQEGSILLKYQMNSSGSIVSKNIIPLLEIPDSIYNDILISIGEASNITAIFKKYSNNVVIIYEDEYIEIKSSISITNVILNSDESLIYLFGDKDSDFIIEQVNYKTKKRNTFLLAKAKEYESLERVYYMNNGYYLIQIVLLDF